LVFLTHNKLQKNINPRVRNILKISLSSTARNRKPITIGDSIKGLNSINAMQEGSDLPKYLMRGE
jgi:hypothetical protein